MHNTATVTFHILCNGLLKVREFLISGKADILTNFYIFKNVLSITNKMQRYTIFFIVVNVLHVSGGFSAHHQELKNYTHSIWYMPSLFASTASVGEFQLTHVSGSSKQARHIPDAVCTVFELLMMLAATASVG